MTLHIKVSLLEDDYGDWLGGYGRRVSENDGNRNQYDNVARKREPVLHCRQDSDFVPDR